MPKKQKKSKETKTKNKNAINVKININSNNKKKSLVQQNKKAIQPTSSPIVISHAPQQPYLQPQRIPNNNLSDNLSENNYGIGITNKLNALDGGLTRIYEENVAIREGQRLAELAYRTHLSKFDELQAEIKARAEEQLRSGAPEPENVNVPSSASIKSQKSLFSEPSETEAQIHPFDNDYPEKQSSLLSSTNLFGNSDRNIIDEDNKSVKSLINLEGAPSETKATKDDTFDKRRSARNKEKADQSDTPELKHQNVIKRLNASLKRHNNDLDDPVFNKFADKLISNGDIDIHEYHKWTMTKGEWAKMNQGM